MTNGRKRKLSSTQDDVNQHSVREFAKPTKVPRKEKRKQERKMKKIRKQAFSQRKAIPTVESMAKEKKEALASERKKKEKRRVKNRKREARRKAIQKEKDDEEQKKRDFEAANKQEDKMIKQLEKQLGLNKRKSKTIPKGFIEDGLADLLDVVDTEKIKHMMEQGENPEDSGEMDILRELEGSSDESGSEADDEEFDMSDSHEESDDDQDNGNTNLEIEMLATDVKGILKSGEKQRKPAAAKSVNFEAADERISSQLSKELELSEDVENESDSESGDDQDDKEESDAMSDPTNSPVGGGTEEEEESNSEKNPNDSQGYSEDIYGRLKDAEGKLVSGSKAFGSYVPPGKRQLMANTTDQKKKLELEKMNKKIKGLINRLSEANIQGIGSQIEEMYHHQSRAYLSEALTKIILDACVAPTIIPERLIMEHVMLIAFLHTNVGSEVGALFLQELVNRFHELFSLGHPYGGNKQLDNILVILSHLYSFKVIQCTLVHDVMRKFVGNFDEKDIEMLLLLLRSVGFDWRKDDATTLKEMIVDIQSKASQANTSHFSDPSRVKFMLEILMAIRNNNMRKIPNYDPSHLEHLKKLLRNYVRGNTSEGQLSISLDDLLNADKQGRWWLVGSAWLGRDSSKADEIPGTDLKSTTTLLSGVSEHILELARKQRMNTDVRKNIFCIIMTSEDFVDAFEKLLRLGLKNQQEREIVHVILDVSIQEKQYNPFYSYLLQKFCEYNRRFQMTVQFTFWDRLKIMKEHTESQIGNLASLLTHLLATKALSLSVFKVVEFSELDKGKLKLMKKVLHRLLTKHPDYVVSDVFARIAPFPKLKMLREGLQLFMNHFLLKSKSKELKDGKNLESLKERITLAENSMGSANIDFFL